MGGTRRWRLSYILLPSPAELGSGEGFHKALYRLAELGFEAVELSLPEPPGIDLDTLDAVARRAGLRVCAMLTGWSYFDEGLCLCSPKPEVRDRAVSRLLGRIEQAVLLGAILVVGQMQGFRQDEPDGEIGIARIAEGLSRVCEVAERRGVQIVLEPVNHLQAGFNHTVSAVQELARRIGSPALKPMVDTFHMNIEERSLSEPILRLGAGLGHVHLCESNGGPFGSGKMDFVGVCRALDEIQYAGHVSCKVYREADWEAGAISAVDTLRRVGAL